MLAVLKRCYFLSPQIHNPEPLTCSSQIAVLRGLAPPKICPMEGQMAAEMLKAIAAEHIRVLAYMVSRASP